MNNDLKVGSHISIRGGYAKAARRAIDMGARSFQYFPKNPRRLYIKDFDAKDAEKCRILCVEAGIVSIAHTPYPVNLAVDHSHEQALYDLTVRSIQNDLIIAEACGSLGVVVHFGQYKGNDPLQGYKNILKCLNEVLLSWEGNTKILIENQAGHGHSMGTTLEEMVNIRKLSQFPEKIGFCFDTCHAFTAGTWDTSHSDSLFEKGHVLDYWRDLIAVHLNDSRFPYGSGQDRHARVGEGFIGEQAFQELLTYHGILDTAIVMETEAGEDGTHKDDIARVLRWTSQ
ncbi:deoxyribonuclease IV [Paenibacillus glacialis]|uniref:Endonuclease IV n=1 Tax=Paenibacillus glacialis TaxID=494026 RepID=A0A168MD38_9BACL|nr:deoxyribonuclease IV [Paenibacillus glacialis]OAB44530.1 endonuclease IV [Paenibacillus glacialis]